MEEKEKIIYYSVGCPTCDDGFKDFFIFCIQNKIDYEFKRNIEGVDEPILKYRNHCLTGDDMAEEFKRLWREDHAV